MFFIIFFILLLSTVESTKTVPHNNPIWGRHVHLSQGQFEPRNTLSLKDGGVILLLELSNIDRIYGVDFEVLYIVLMKLTHEGEVAWTKLFRFLRGDKEVVPGRMNIQSSSILTPDSSSFAISGYFSHQEPLPWGSHHLRPSNPLIIRPFTILMNTETGEVQNSHIFSPLEETLGPYVSFHVMKDGSFILLQDAVFSDRKISLVTKFSPSLDQIIWSKRLFNSIPKHDVHLTSVYEKGNSFHFLGKSNFFTQNTNETYTTEFILDKQTGIFTNIRLFRDEQKPGLTDPRRTSISSVFRFSRTSDSDSDSFISTHTWKIFEVSDDSSVRWCKQLIFPKHEIESYDYNLHHEQIIPSIEEDGGVVLLLDEVDLGLKGQKLVDLEARFESEIDRIQSEGWVSEVGLAAMAPVLKLQLSRMKYQRSHAGVENSFLLKFSENGKLKWSRVIENKREMTQKSGSEGFSTEMKYFDSFDLDRKENGNGYLITSHYHNIKLPLFFDVDPKNLMSELRSIFSSDMIIYNTDRHGRSEKCGLKTFERRSIKVEDCSLGVEIVKDLSIIRTYQANDSPRNLEIYVPENEEEEELDEEEEEIFKEMNRWFVSLRETEFENILANDFCDGIWYPTPLIEEEGEEEGEEKESDGSSFKVVFVVIVFVVLFFVCFVFSVAVLVFCWWKNRKKKSEEIEDEDEDESSIDSYFEQDTSSITTTSEESV